MKYWTKGHRRFRTHWMIYVLLACAVLAWPIGSPPFEDQSAAPSVVADEVASAASNVTGVNLTESSTSIQLPSDFWGSTINARYSMVPDEEELTVATPATTLVWPGGNAGDDYDPLNNLIFHPTNGSSYPDGSTNQTNFIQFCKSINCTPIFEVPGEIDQPSIAYDVVSEIKQAWGNLSNTYWEIGNEPQLWKRWDQNWSEWSTLPTEKTAPTPIEYAEEVHDYIPEMDSAAGIPLKIIGIASTARNNGGYSLGQWVAATIQVNGPELTAVAFHEYPAGHGGGTANLTDFYASLTGANAIPHRMAQISSAFNQSESESCRAENCNISVMITEDGSALNSSNWGRWFSATFAGALDTGAQMTQAMNYDAVTVNQTTGIRSTLTVANIDLFSSVSPSHNSWVTISPHDQVNPVYAIYSDILSHLGDQVYPTSVSGLGGSVFAVTTVDPADSGREDLLVINTNVTQSAQFEPALAGYDSVAPQPVELTEWNGTLVSAGTRFENVTAATPEPLSTYLARLPQSFTLRPQALVLFESFPRLAAPVDFVASGLSAAGASARWFLNVSGATLTSTTSSITVFAPADTTLSVTAPALYLPLNGTEKVPEKRLEPFVAAREVVPAQPETVNLTFALQWRTSIEADPIAGGFVSTSPSWWNQSQALNLEPEANLGYAFTYWTGYGSYNTTYTPDGTTYGGIGKNGSYEGPDFNAVIIPTGRINETAHFAVGYSVTFEETGLPEGTDWSIAVRSQFDLNGQTLTGYYNQSSFTNLIVDQLVNGTHAFSVDDVPGYRAVPSDSAVNVSGGSAVVTLRFQALTPPGPQYPITFLESGLPAGTYWSITARNDSVAVTGNTTTVTIQNVTRSSTADSIVFWESNGSYGYRASTVQGFRAHPPSDGFEVDGSAMVVNIAFAAVLYDVVWIESGLGPNLSWGVDLGADRVASSGAWTVAQIPNGTYSYSVPVVESFVPSNVGGKITVSGSGLVLNLVFARRTFPLLFLIDGAGQTTSWQIRLGNSTVVVTGSRVEFYEPNGSYTYDIEPPIGLSASPSHGVATVDAASWTQTVQFSPTGPPVVPDIWSLALPALEVAAAVSAAAATTIVALRRARRLPPSGTS